MKNKYIIGQSNYIFILMNIKYALDDFKVIKK